MTFGILGSSIVLLMVTGAVLGGALGLTGLVLLHFEAGNATSLAVQAVWNSFTDFTLSAVPLFIFLGDILLANQLRVEVVKRAQANPRFLKQMSDNAMRNRPPAPGRLTESLFGESGGPDRVDLMKGATFTCDLELDGGQTATAIVTQTDDRGSVSWKLDTSGSGGSTTP